MVVAGGQLPYTVEVPTCLLRRTTSIGVFRPLHPPTSAEETHFGRVAGRLRCAVFEIAQIAADTRQQFINDLFNLQVLRALHGHRACRVAFVPPSPIGGALSDYAA